MNMPDASSLTGFANNPLDRRSHLREDAAAIEALKATGHVLVFSMDKPVAKQGADGLDALFSSADAQTLGVAPDLYLGLLAGRGVYAGITALDEEALKARGLAVVDLRSLALQRALSPERLAMLGQARAMLNWHATHTHCARCGTPTDIAQAGFRRECPRCHAQHFPRTDPVVIMLVVHEGKCLLGRKSVFPPGMHSCLAGFLEPGETIEEAVRRETLEEAGIRTGRVVYHASQPWPMPFAQLMIGCFAQGLNADITLDDQELESARWYDVEECRALLERSAPDGQTGPAHFAIAHLLIRAFVDGQCPF
jgi:NAD+ diphosphatase